MRTCNYCHQPLAEDASARRIYCDRKCAGAAQRAMPGKTCTADGCGRKVLARGMCGTHYNRTRPDRHKPKTVVCIVCGKEKTVVTGGGRKYGNVCSQECRYILTYGERTELPKDHWARWFGATSAVFPMQCAWCPKRFVSTQTQSLYCSSHCSSAVHDRRRTAREYGADGEYRWSQVFDMWVALSRRCAYCMNDLPLHKMQVEHVTPLSRGGRNDRTNLLPACGPCNVDKSDRTLSEWDTDRLTLGQAPRTSHINANDARFRHLVITTPTGTPYRLTYAKAA